MLKLGCDEAQGFLFAKPMPYKKLLVFLDAQDN
jgi:EAL domain-containing protein (putative c-di-GMP-specific phosphodiesterase class I)